MDSQEPSTVDWRVWVRRHAPHLLLFARQQTRCEAGAETFFRKRSRAAQDAESAPDMNETDTEFTLFERQLREYDQNGDRPIYHAPFGLVARLW